MVVTNAFGTDAAYTRLADAGVASEPHGVVMDRQLGGLVRANPQHRAPFSKAHPGFVVLRTPRAQVI